MKKIVGLSIAPLLLCALVPLQNAQWKRLDAEFRRVIEQQASEGSKAGYIVSISKPNAACDLGVWTPAEMKAALAEVRLQPAQNVNPDWPGLTLYFGDYRSDTRDSLGFCFALEGQQSHISNLDTSGDSLLEKWDDFQLTPESVAALKKRVMASYGKEIEAFKSPDWGQPNRGKKP